MMRSGMVAAKMREDRGYCIRDAALMNAPAELFLISIEHFFRVEEFSS